MTNTPTQALSGLGKVVLAPVPVAAGTPVCLYAEKPVASSQWTIVNFVGESVASLSFGAVSLPCWDTTGVPAGLYLVRLTIAYGDGSTATSWHKVVVTP